MSYSREVQALVDYVESTGLPYRVTDVNGPGHATNSYHYAKATDGQGLAVDFGGVVPGVTALTAKQMAAIYHAFLNVAPQLAELIYSGVDLDGRPVTQAVHMGRRVDGASFYGPATWRDHWNHVHVAVPRGTFLAPLVRPLRTLEATMADDPNLPNITGPVEFHPIFNSAGHCTGYYIFSQKTGELHSYGPGADGKGLPYYGRSEVTS